MENERPAAYEALKLQNQVCFPVYACAKEIVRQYGPFLKDLGLTYTQYLVMLVLWETETVCSRDLSKKLHLDYGTLTPVLKRLDGAGLLTRERDPGDERLLTIRLTEEGRRKKEQAARVPHAVAGCMGLTMEEFGQLYLLAYKALAHMEQRSTEHTGGKNNVNSQDLCAPGTLVFLNMR